MYSALHSRCLPPSLATRSHPPGAVAPGPISGSVRRREGLPAAEVGLDEGAGRHVVGRLRAPARVDAADVGRVEAARAGRRGRSRRAHHRGIDFVSLEGRRPGADEPDVTRAAELALEAEDVEGRRGRHQKGGPDASGHVLDRHRVRPRERAEGAEGPVGSEAADELSGAVDGRGRRHVHQLLRRLSRRGEGRGADAPGVEDLERKRERVDPLEEERPLLRQQRLEVGQVEDHLVRFDLGEVGVEGAVEGQVLGDVPFEVEARRASRGERAPEHVGPGVAPPRVGEPERQQLERARALEPAQIVEASEEGDRARDVAREVGPQIVLLSLGDEAGRLQAPALHGQAAVEAQRAQRDPDLRRPARGRAGGLRLPVFVPLPGEGRLVENLSVRLHARDVDREHERALSVVARVDVDPDPFALRVPIAAGQPLDDRRVDLLAVEADVDRRSRRRARGGSCARTAWRRRRGTAG